MSSNPGLLCSIVIAALLTNVTIAGPTLIGASSDGTLYDIDPSTGVVSNVRETGRVFVSGLAYEPDGSLFVQTGRPGTSAQGLYAVFDPSTGESSVVNNATGVISFDIEFNTIASSLLGLHGPEGEIFTLDSNSGIGTLTGLTIGNSGPVASNTDGETFAVLTGQDALLGALPHGEDRVISFDPATGDLLSQWIIDVDMTYASSTFLGDTLFILDQEPGLIGTLYSFNTISGTLSAVNTIVADEQLVALAYVPEPETCVLLSVLVSVATARVYRRRLYADS